jgi:hypothetical protein
MVVRKKWQWKPSQQGCEEIARHLIEGLKQLGVPQMVREVSPHHSMSLKAGRSEAPVTLQWSSRWSS